MNAQTGNQQGKASDIDLSWLGGLWDGEGSIGIKVQKYRGKHTYFHPYAQVVNSHKATMERVHEILTASHLGHYLEEQARRKTPIRGAVRPIEEYLTLYVARINGLKRVKALLEVMTPFFFTKREVAEWVWDFIKSREQSPRTWSPYTEYELNIVNRFRIGRHRGRFTEPISLESLNDYTPGAANEAVKV